MSALAYHQQDFSQRYGRLGDESEAKFVEVTPFKVERYGLERPSINMAKLPPFIRYTPDYLQHNRLVECMGIGRDGVLKLKVEKLFALNQWDLVHPVDLFVWDSAAKRWTQQPLHEVQKACMAHAEVKQFPEGKPAWFLDTRRLVWDWTPYAAT